MTPDIPSLGDIFGLPTDLEPDPDRLPQLGELKPTVTTSIAPAGILPGVPGPGATPPDEMPFTPRYGLTRICPDCKRNLPLNSLNWYHQKRTRNVSKSDESGDTWIVREKVDVPSTYCKPCTSKRNSAGAKARRALLKLPPEQRLKARIETMQGPCSVCGKTANVLRLVSTHEGACLNCHSLLRVCDFDVEVARQHWLSLFKHLGDEERVQRQVAARTNRIHIAYHQFNPDWPEDQQHLSHVVCIAQEHGWRCVYRWLKNRQDATHPPPEDEG